MSESVAWITERKNVLSGMLYLGAVLTYLHSRESTPIRWRRRMCPRAWRNAAAGISAALGLFVAAL